MRRHHIKKKEIKILNTMCYHYLFVTGQQESISGFKNSYRQDFHEIINYPITHHAAQNDLLECISFDPASRRVRIDAPQWNSANSSKMKYPYIDPSLLHDVIDMCELEFVGKDSILIRFNPYYWDFIGFHRSHHGILIWISGMNITVASETSVRSFG
jgi:hypothetical protein